jgi:glycosyltransferase involved in cell wall biosynthesis
LNQRPFIADAVRSVVDQDYGRLQYVIQDGGSTDGTLDVLERLGEGKFQVHVEADRGQADAINRGFARTGAEIMGWLNSDDMLAPGTLHRVGQFFRDHPAVEMIYGNRRIIDHCGQEIGRWILPGHDEPLLRFVDYVPQETMFWRRRLWERVGACLNVDLQFALDWDLLLRFVEAGARIRHVPDLFGIFRVHESQKTQVQLRSNGRREMLWIRSRYGGLKLSPWRRAVLHFRFLWRHRVADRRFEESQHEG